MQNEIKLFTGNANPELALNISRSINVPLGKIHISRFPEDEIFVKILENVRGCDVFVVQPTLPDPNDSMMELLIIIDALKRASAKQITVVIPCYAYARQDRKDQPRVPVTAKLVANLITAAGADRVLTLDLHAGQIQGFFDIPLDNLYAFPVFIDYIRRKDLSNAVIVSTDIGGNKLAAAFSTRLNLPLAIVDKRRVNDIKVEAVAVIGDVKAKDVIFVDDIITTGGSLAEASRIVKEHGARDIIACVTHGVLVGPALSRLKESPLKQLIVTDTVPLDGKDREFNIEILTISGLLGQAIMRIHRNESVSSLFF